MMDREHHLLKASLHNIPSNHKKSSGNNTSNYFSQENSSLLQRFTIEMERACTGLENLKSTYSDDVRIISEIDIMIEQLRLRIEKINNPRKRSVHQNDNDPLECELVENLASVLQQQTLSWLARARTWSDLQQMATSLYHLL